LCIVEQRRSLIDNGFEGDCHDHLEVYLNLPFAKAEERKSQTWQPVTSGYRSSAAAANHHYHHGKEEYDKAGAQNKFANENDDTDRRKATVTAIEG
jgi:hypothetical protein